MNITKYINKENIFYVLIIVLLLINIYVTFRCVKSHNTKKEQFDQTTTITKNVTYGDEIVLYYASWCGYSRVFLPEWEKFKQWASVNAKSLKVTSIRCESGNEELCIEKGIRGYPTVILYPKEGTEVVFNGERTAENLADFVKKELIF